MRPATFTFEGVEYPYCDGAYNDAAHNMRSVEVPIAQRFIADFAPEDVLEIGSVLQHYGTTAPTVVDLRDGTVREDVMTWKPRRTYKAIVSISTLEHIGHGRYAAFTAPNLTPTTIVKRLYRWLDSGGVMLATIPIGYNSHWDVALLTEKVSLAAKYMCRINDDNEWRECSKLAAFAVDPRRWHKGGAVAIMRWSRL